MSTPSHGSPPPLTVSQVEDWIATATTKHGELYLLATEPLYNTLRDQALFQMSQLLQEAIEKVRVVSTTLREESQTLHSKAAALRERSAQLIQHSAPFATPFRTRDMPQAEAPVLPMFQDAVQRQDGDNKSEEGPPKEGVA
jgi:uncharacterized caspase-like protein